MSAEDLADPVAPRALRHPTRARAAPGAHAAQPAAGPQADATELAHVPVAKLAAVGEPEDDARVRVRGRAAASHDERAGHPQRDRHDPPVVEMEQDRLRAPADPADSRTGDLRREPLRRLRVADRPIPMDRRVDDRGAGDEALEVTRDGLDLGKFRHAVERGGSSQHLPVSGAGAVRRYIATAIAVPSGCGARTKNPKNP